MIYIYMSVAAYSPNYIWCKPQWHYTVGSSLGVFDLIDISKKMETIV